MRRLSFFLALFGVLATVLATGLIASPVSAATPPIVYRNLPNPVPGNVNSEAFQAQTVSEFGDRIDFEASTPRLLSSVDVLMSSWGCESGSWNLSDCVTTPNATFSHPITLNIYDVGPSNAPGTLLGTRTQTFAIPYRPSADDLNCTGGNDGKWFNGTACFNGFATMITFDLTSLSLTVPDEVIMSVAYNTSSYGYAPIGAAACQSESGGCGYDSLNVGLSSVTVPNNVDHGSNPAPNDAYLYAANGGGVGYCTNTGLNVFRLDAGCWIAKTGKPALTVYASSCTTICYVDDVAGNDGNTGSSPAEAKKTIQGGINAVDPNGEVRVLPGSYDESPDVNKSLTLVSTAGRNSTFINLQTGPTYLGSLFIEGDDVTVDGFTVVGRDGTDSVVGAANIVVKNALDDIVVKNNKLRVGLADTDCGCNTSEAGIGIVTYYNTTPAQFTASLTVTNNLIEPLSSAATRAFYVNPGVTQFNFEDNSITGNFDRTSATEASSALIKDNTVTGSGSSAGLAAEGYQDPDTFGQATFTGNHISGVANGISVFEANNTNIHHNVITSSGTAVRVLDDGTFTGTVDPSTVHVNRNSLAVGAGNNGITAEPDFSSSVDGTCNWWGNFTGPGPIASGTGSKVTSNVEYAPWLQSSNLDSECSPNGNLTIVLDTHPNSSRLFSFTGTNGIAPFTLKDDGTPGANTKTWSKPAGLYVFRVGAVPKWALIKLTCNTHETILRSHRLVQIQLHSDENVTCTFTESYRIPDASIALTSGGPYSGDNIYSGGVLPSQSLAQSFAPGQTKSFFVRLQNDGLDQDTFRAVSKLKGSLKYGVVFMAGNVEITGKVNAGTYKFTLAPGATRMIEIRVTAGSISGADARQIILTMQSKTAPDARDTVKAYVNSAP